MRNHTYPLLEELLASVTSSGNPADPDGAALARVLARLVEHEIEEGGPYALTPGGIPEKPDLGMNAAVAVYLGAHDVRLPNLDAFLDERLASGVFHSRALSQATLEDLLTRVRALPKRPASPSSAPLRYDAREKKVLDAIRRKARDRFAGLPASFAENAHEVIGRTVRRNSDKQMSLMPLYIRAALGENGERFDDERLAGFGLANVFFWTAFIIYDDFWDEDEAAEPRLLPVANLFARHYVRFFENVLPGETGFNAFFHRLMDNLDAANEWEMLCCRLKREGDRLRVPEQLPDYGDYTIKFYPAAGHVLGPVAMLAELGYAPGSKEVASLLDYFRHYLIAMQLNDDAHDWKEDLARGHISTAVALLLGAWKRTHPARTHIDLAQDLPELERLFWFETISPLCEATLAHTRQSSEALDSLTFLENPEPLRKFITRNEAIATEALREQKRSVEFLSAV